MFKGCKYFGEFIIKYKTRPNKEELAIFYYNRYIEAGKKNTLPHLTEQWINDFLVAYEPIFEKKTIPEIVESLKASAKKEKVHSEWTFPGDLGSRSQLWYIFNICCPLHL